MIDAVYSIGVRYDAVRRVIDRYTKHFQLPAFREDRTTLPLRAKQESISSFYTRFERAGLSEMTTIFANRQRTSTRNGILKAEAVYRFASALRAHGVEYFQDVSSVANSPTLDSMIRGIPGQRSSISLQYFWMLAGSDEFIKPDRMVLRFLEKALGRAVSVPDAQRLLSDTAERLRSQYTALTPRLLDHEIWKYQREQH